MKLSAVVPFVLKAAPGVLLLLGGCVQVVDKLPTLEERQQAAQIEQRQAQAHDNETRLAIWKRCVAVRHLETEFIVTGRELPLGLKQAEKICEDER